MTEFLIDENILGLDRYLEGNVKYQKVGDNECLPLGSSDSEVARIAKLENLVIVTGDTKLIKQCLVMKTPFITFDMMDLAKKVLEYSKLNSFDGTI